MIYKQSTDKPLISDEVVSKWQTIVDLIAQKVGVPASRITRIESLHLEIFVTSATKGNPYRNGEKLKLDGRTYCKSVISKDAPLLVPTALYDPEWDNKPDKVLGMISYLGFPLHWPDGEIFGTLCVFDSKENHYSNEHRDLLAECKDVIETDLKALTNIDDSAAHFASVTANEGEQKLRVLADHVPAFFSYIGPDMKYQYANQQYEKVFGIAQQKIVGRHVSEILGEQSFNSIKHHLVSALSGNEVSYETELPITPAGTRWMAVRLVPDIASDSVVKGIYVLVNDLTERKKTERALEKSEHKYRELVDEAATIILRWDIKGNVTFFNEYAQKFFGFTEEEILGENVVGTIVPETEFTGRDLALLMEEICKDPAKFEDNENENIKCNGERVWIAWKNRPIYNERGELFEIHSVGIDITARKRAEDALRQSEARWRSITENSPDNIIMVDRQGNILSINYTVPDLSVEQVVGTPMTNYLPPTYQQIAHDCLEAVWATGKPGQFIVEYQDAEGGKQYFESNVGPVKDSGTIVALIVSARNVTERILAEKRLIESESTARALLNTPSVLTLLLDTEGKILDTNDVMAARFSKSPEEMVGLTLEDILPPEVLKIRKQHMLTTIQTGKAHSWEDFRAGSWFESCSTPIFDEQGNVTKVAIVAFDITERKQAAEVLRSAHDELEKRVKERTVELKDINEELVHQKALFEAVFRDVPDAMVIADVNREIIMCNPALTNIYGYEPEEVIGQKTAVLYENFEEFERQGRERFNLAAEEKTKPYTVIYKRKDGELFPGETVGTPIKDESGSTIGFMGVIRDITDRQLAEQELKRSRQHFQYLDRLSHIISQAPDLNTLLGNVLQEMLEIFSVDRAWLIYPGEPDAASWKVPMEVTSEGFSGAFDLSMDIPRNADTESVMRDVLEANGPVIYDFYRMDPVPDIAQSFNIKTQMIIALYPRIDKPWILGLHQCSHNREWTDSDKRLFPDIAERMTSALTNRLLLEQLETDIAQRKRAEEQAKLHQAELAHMARLNIMGEMATGIAHELNQPLTAIANYAAVGSEMVDAGNKDPDKLVKALDSVQMQAERASEIIRRLRQFVKKQSPQRINVSINSLVQDVMSFMEAETRKQNIQTQLELAGELPLVFADAIQIEQVLLNIIRNSLDAMLNANIEDPLLVIKTSINGDNYIHVDVSDTGPGIDEATLGHIFEPFVTTKGAQGMGMGLSISRSIIEAHGGRLWVESEVGRGATFYFTLPVNVGEKL